MSESVFQTENLKKTYFKMALPVVFGMVITLIYNLADTYFIAGTGNIPLIAGVSLCSPVFTTLMAVGNIYGQGGSSFISRLLGKGDYEGVKRISAFTFYGAILTGFIMLGAMLLLAEPILFLMGADNETFMYAKEYYGILALGAPFITMNFVHGNEMRCEGMAVESMIGTVLGAVWNIIWDPILIFGFDMGAKGAAIATVFGYIVSDLYLLWTVKRKSKYLSVQPRNIAVDKEEMKQIFGVGTTAAVTNFTQSLSVIFINQSLLIYGNDKIAVMGIVLKINLIAQLLLVGFSFGGVPLFGYFYGKKDIQKLKELIHFCMKFLLGLAVAMTALIVLFSSGLLSGFVKEEIYITLGIPMLRWQVAGTVFAAIVLLMTVLFQAAGKIFPSFLMSISRQGVVFILLLLLLGKIAGYQGVLMAQAAADLFSALLAGILYKKYMSEEKSR